MSATDQDQPAAVPGEGGDSLALQNGGGLTLGLFGAAIGLLKSSPLFAFLGLVGGLIAGSLAIDRRQGVIGAWLGGHPKQDAAPLSSERKHEAISASAKEAAPQGTLPAQNGILHDASFDEDFSRSQSSLASSPKLAQRSPRQHR